MSLNVFFINTLLLIVELDIPSTLFEEIMTHDFVRLSTDVKPINYNICLTPNLDSLTFTGAEVIDIEVQVATKSVVLNSVDIDIQNTKYESSELDSMTAEVVIDAESETATLKFPSLLKVGDGKLHLQFSGNLNNQLIGFYRSKYTTSGGIERYGAVTQFAATDARRALPCWDEPAIKATFDVSLVVPKDRVALSNMPVANESETANGLRCVKFDRTPVMSTYLLAFIVGEYDYVEAKDSDGVLIRVYTPVGKKNQGEFALEVARKTLPFYKDYFGIPYPLPKMDLIAVVDLAPGAMENWGLVTFRERALLVDPYNPSSATRQKVALIVGHELAHQWFGNLVTMEWWTHLWLNEGFASFIEYLCVDHCFPEFDIWTQFVNQDLARALELDALKNSHPIEVEVGHPAEVDEIFDAISYCKGASVIRMLHEWIGDEAFRKGMNQYLTKYAYKNTMTEDLWHSLEAASGKPVRKVMNTWTSQMGFPVLEVSEKQEGTNRIISVTQSKFNADGTDVDNTCLWMVPINFTSSANPDKYIVADILTTKTAEFTLKNVNNHDWVKLNPGTVGVYRVQYSSTMLDSLTRGLNSFTLPIRDRLGLENDLFALARAGLLPISKALEAALALKSESHYSVWADLTANLGDIGILTEYTDYHDMYKRFCCLLYSDIAKTLGWRRHAGECSTQSMLRTLVLYQLGSSGHSETVNECFKRLNEHLSGTCPLDADLQLPVYGTVLKHGDVRDFERILEIYHQTTSSDEKVKVLQVLGEVKSKELISRVLEFTFSDSVRVQDIPTCFMGLGRSANGRKLAWDFLKANWESRLKNVLPGVFLLANVLKRTLSSFADVQVVDDIQDFFTHHPVPAAQRAIQQACENIRINDAVLKREHNSMKLFFSNLISDTCTS